MNTEDKRHYLISVSANLFQQFGFVATGIDRIVEESGVAKTTLYRYFPSKEDLIVAVLSDRDVRFRNDLRVAVDNSSSNSKKKILAAFDFLDSWISDQNFNGCLFVCAATEFEKMGHPARAVALRHKKCMREYFRELARDAGFLHAGRIAGEIQILLEGAIAVAHVQGKSGAAGDAKAIARRLLSAEPMKT